MKINIIIILLVFPLLALNNSNLNLTSLSKEASVDNEWKVYIDEYNKFKVSYPVGWTIKSGKGAFMCSKPESETEWLISVSKLDNKERIELLKGELFERTITEEKLIEIDGESCSYISYTVKLFPDRLYKELIFQTEDLYYQITDESGTKDEMFKNFYESFKLIK